MADTQPVSRPLSPHLQIYRRTMTMMMSIAHRISGAALYLGTLLLAWWLLSVAAGPEVYALFESFISSWLGRLILFGFTWALMHHMLGGIRHFIWDMGKGFSLPVANAMAWMTLVGGFVLTLFVWWIGYSMMGAM
jgi:succinate dehydrogenase / fumarate reductase cytochrome b subunit